ATKSGPDDGAGRLLFPPGEGADRPPRVALTGAPDRSLASVVTRVAKHGFFRAERRSPHGRVRTGAACPGDPDCVGMAGRIALPAREGPTLSFFHIPPRRRLVMPATYNILIMGASYGSLLASKLLFGGHQVKLVCLLAAGDLINAEGSRVRWPVKGRKEPVEIDSRKLPGKVSAGGPADVDPTEYDLVGLAMQEPQYRSPGVRQLLDAVARSKVPCMSIMNMPPLPYLKRIPVLNTDPLKVAYTDPSVWDSFD